MVLPAPASVGQQEPDAGQFHEVFVDGFQLMGQGVHAGDGETEVGVKLVGYAHGVGLNAEPEEVAVPFEGWMGLGDL